MPPAGSPHDSQAAGCGAILEALDKGATVVALEKTDQVGGMTFGTEGVFG